ncbi:YggT family protein [Ktedonosporobacter rubrisoli]|nr:YggT family protein [Ktedonosporobacter rubrisoli]
MRNNPYPDEPTSVQPTEAIPRAERMEDLQPRPAPPPPPVPQPTPEGISSVDSEELHQEEARTVRYAIGKLNDFLQWFVVVLEVTLAIRFVLKLIGADPTNMFAGFLYSLTSVVLFPFSTIVHSPSLHPNQAFEWSTLIAMIIYYLIFWAIRRFLRIIISSPEEAAS